MSGTAILATSAPRLAETVPVLPSSHRLRLRRDFGRATRLGRRAGSATVVVHLASDVGAGEHGDGHGATDPARVGFIVSRACGPAVVRNRIRRRLRHLVLQRLHDLPAGSLVVVRALPSAADSSSQRLHVDLERCIDRLLLAGGRP